MNCSDQNLPRRPRSASEGALRSGRWAAVFSSAQPSARPTPLLFALVAGVFVAGLRAGVLTADPARQGARTTPAEKMTDALISTQTKDGVDMGCDRNRGKYATVVPNAAALSSQPVPKADSGDEACSGGVEGNIDVGDWDWSGVVDMDVGPADRRALANRRVQELAKKPRVGDTAEPDFDRPVRSAHQLFPKAVPFKVVASKKDPDIHPCLDCHSWAESDLTPRELKDPHDNFQLSHGLHGKGKFWCFTCHHLDGEGGLHTLEGEKLSFDDAYVICSQCHAQEARDWVFGGHGKRVGNWRGPRQVLTCTACHYQHRPRLKARKPMPGPKMRMGLKRPAHWVAKDRRPNGQGEGKHPWERYGGPWHRASP